VHRLGFLNHDSIAICSENYACVLRECARSGASAEGKQLHSYILQSGLNVVKFPPVQHLSLIKKPHKILKVVGICVTLRVLVSLLTCYSASPRVLHDLLFDRHLLQIHQIVQLWFLMWT
jgi:hypothetical protein